MYRGTDRSFPVLISEQAVGGHSKKKKVRFYKRGLLDELFIKITAWHMHKAAFFRGLRLCLSPALTLHT